MKKTLQNILIHIHKEEISCLGFWRVSCWIPVPASQNAIKYLVLIAQNSVGFLHCSSFSVSWSISCYVDIKRSLFQGKELTSRYGHGLCVSFYFLKWNRTYSIFLVRRNLRRSLSSSSVEVDHHWIWTRLLRLSSVRSWKTLRTVSVASQGPYSRL